jgi:hypothetical protein
MNTTAFEREPMSSRSPTGFAVWGLGLVVGLLFVGLGLTKLLPAVAAEFARFGIPSGVRLLVGAAEVGGGLLFCRARTGFGGACVLAAVLAGAIGVYFAAGPDDAPVPLLPVGMLVLLGVVTWGRGRAAWWRRYLAVLDRFAESQNAPGGNGRVG